MRWIRDIVLLVVLSAIGAGVLWYQSQRREEQATIDKTTADTLRLEREVHFHAAMKKGDMNARGWPVTVDPAWFENDPPRNLLVSEDRPWVEVASPDDAGLLHPPVRMTLDDSSAAFWYNPYQGVVRARVPVEMTDEAATSLYNAINRTNITSIHWRETPMEIPKPKQDKSVGADVQKDGSAPEPKLTRREPTIVTVKRTKTGSRKR